MTEAFGQRALLARAGLILGPCEDVGRLTWWLNRMASGGEILAPGPADLEIQLIDSRDLAIFVLDAALAGQAGPFNVISRRGHATMRSLLESCRTVAGTADAHLTWVEPEAIAAAGIEPWSELLIWLRSQSGCSRELRPAPAARQKRDCRCRRQSRALLLGPPVSSSVVD